MIRSTKSRSDETSDFYAQTYASLFASQKAAKTIDAQFSSAMRDHHASYFAGSTSRYLPQPPGINPLGTGADYHYSTERNYFLMVERARFDDRDNMVIGQAVDRVVANVLQEGFRLAPKTGDEELDDHLRARWEEWSTSRTMCDYDGERTFDQLADMVLRDEIVAGDIFGIPTSDGKIQLLENHHCRNPHGHRNRLVNGNGIIHGCELMGNRRQAYHFLPDDIAGTTAISHRQKMRRIPLFDDAGNRQVFHCHLSKRTSQRRGVTAFAPIVFTSKYHDDLQFANLVNAKRNSFIAIVRELEAGATRRGKGAQSGTRTGRVRDDGTDQTLEGGSPGQTIKGEAGERIKPWSPQIPGVQFFPHAELLLTIMSINLDLPLMVFMLDASSTNFNGYRGVIDQARMRFRKRQGNIRTQFHSEAYRFKVRQWLTEDPVLARVASRTGVNVFRHTFTPRGWDYIQPVQDAAADMAQIRGNLTSARRVASQKKGVEDYGELLDEIVGDRVGLIRRSIIAAEDLNTEFPDANVQWREVANLNDQGVKVTLSGSVDDTTTTPDNGKTPTDTEERRAA